MLSRQLFDRSREVHDGTWKKVAVGCHEIRGKTLGIVGYGHIGRQVGVLAEMVGMQRDLLRHRGHGCRWATTARWRRCASCWRPSDFVTLHVPETPQTRGMIGAAELAQMKPGACLLNASRGTVVDLDGAGRGDPQRPPRRRRRSTSTPRSRRPTPTASARCCATCPTSCSRPHIGGSTEEAQEAIGREVVGLADQVRQHRRHHRRGELPADRAAAGHAAPTASSTCTATCPA